MKYLFIVVVLTMSMFSCKQAPKSDIPVETTDTTKVATPVQETVAAKSDLNSLVAFVGKKPSEVDLFNQNGLGDRVKKLLGAEYEEFIAEFNDQTPLKKDSELIYSSGCKSGSCSSNRYFVIFDLIDNNINIYNFKGKQPKSWEEGAIIGMTSNMSDAFDKIRKEQGM